MSRVSSDVSLFMFDIHTLKGPYLNGVYTEGGGGLTKCRRSKGGCVDLVL